MSNEITAYFKGRTGVAESVYQNDYGIVMNFDSIDLPAHFDCYFSILNQEEAIPGVGADRMVAIPNSVLANPGAVAIHIPMHTGSNDSEVEYIVYFKVIGRARPIDDGTPVQMTAIEQALALLQNPITNIEQIVNEALAFTGDTFAEMQQQLDADQSAFESGIRARQTQVESDFSNLNAQFQTAVSAVTTDTEVTNIRVSNDGVVHATAGESVRKQFSCIQDALSEGYLAASAPDFEIGKINESSGVDESSTNYIRSKGFFTAKTNIHFKKNRDSYMYIIKYDSNGTYKGRSFYGNSVEEDDFVITAGYKYRISYMHYPYATATLSWANEIKLFSEEIEWLKDIQATLNDLDSEVTTFGVKRLLNYGVKNEVSIDWSVGWIDSATGAVQTGNSAIINSNAVTLSEDVIIRKVSASQMQVYMYKDGSFTRIGVDQGKTEYYLVADPDATYRFCYYRVPYETATVDSYKEDFVISYISDELAALERFSAVSGKKWVAIGDSLTDPVTLSVFSGDETKNYTNLVAEKLGLTLANVGVSGSGYWRKSTISPYKGFYQVAQTIPTDADIVTLFGSFNDMGADGSTSGRNILGTIYDDGTATVGGCINQAIKNVIARVPNAVIGIILPTPWNAMTQTASELATYEAYTNLVKGVAERYSLPVLDLFHHSNLRPWDSTFKETYYKDADGVHPNHYGHMRFAGMIADFVESLAKLN